MFDIFKKLGWFFKLRFKSYTIVVLGLIACSILAAFIPIIIGQAVDQMALGTITWKSLNQHVFILFIIGIVMYGLRYMWRSHLFTNSTILEAILRNRLFYHFTKMDSDFYQRYRVGDLMAHATNDLAAIRFVAGGGIMTLTDSISITIVTLFSMFMFVDWKLTLTTILPFPLLILVSRFLGGRLNRSFKKSLNAFSNLNERVQESITGIQVIKAFGEEKEDYQAFEEEANNVVDANRRVSLIDAGYRPSIEFITGLSYVLTIFFGTYFISQGRITIGNLIAYFAYLGNLTWPLLAVGALMNTLERGNVAYDRIDNLLSETAKVISPENGVTDLPYDHLDVNIQSFTYPDANEPALKNIAFSLEEGQTLGIVGKTGSGKTTLFNLLLRYYDLENGYIRYDGVDIKDIDLEALYEKVGYIPQTNLLFSMSIRDNVRFARPTMSQEEINHYTRMSVIHDDILEFPEGYDTLAGERGVSLSGGQKQRISIARTLATQPEILLMDDSMSAVDAKTEREMMQHLKEETSQKMTLIASHRMSSVMHADLIIVLDNGELIEQGTHDSLMEQNGWYAKIYQKQQLEQSMDEEKEE